MEAVQEQREEELPRNEKGQFTKGRFKSGQSGNPGGRPKGVSITAEFNKLLKSDPEKLKNTKPKTGAALKARQIFISDDPSLIKEAWNRIDGKVPQPVQLSGPNGGAIPIMNLTPEQEKARLEALMQEAAENQNDSPGS